jgi:hypothetical protein
MWIARTALRMGGSFIAPCEFRDFANPQFHCAQDFAELAPPASPIGMAASLQTLSPALSSSALGERNACFSARFAIAPPHLGGGVGNREHGRCTSCVCSDW